LTRFASRSVCIRAAAILQWMRRRSVGEEDRLAPIGDGCAARERRRAVQVRGQYRDIGAGLGGKRTALREVCVVPPWPRIVSGKHATDGAITIEHGAQIGRARDDVIARIERISAETMVLPQDSPCSGHDLHQPHGPGMADRTRIARAFGMHHGTDPVFRDRKASRSFGDGGSMRIAHLIVDNDRRFSDSRTTGRCCYGKAGKKVCLARNSSARLRPMPVAIEAEAAPAVTRRQLRPMATAGVRAAPKVPKAKVPSRAIKSW